MNSLGVIIGSNPRPRPTSLSGQLVERRGGVQKVPKNIPYGIREFSRGTKSRNQGIRSRDQSPALPLTRPTGPRRNKDGEKENRKLLIILDSGLI
jgi:hypothetical protein